LWVVSKHAIPVSGHVTSRLLQKVISGIFEFLRDITTLSELRFDSRIYFCT
jgi:hypothetical protein